MWSQICCDHVVLMLCQLQGGYSNQSFRVHRKSPTTSVLQSRSQGWRSKKLCTSSGSALDMAWEMMAFILNCDWPQTFSTASQCLINILQANRLWCRLLAKPANSVSHSCGGFSEDQHGETKNLRILQLHGKRNSNWDETTNFGPTWWL